MAEPSVENALVRAEDALDAGNDLDGTGFWSAVSRVKENPELAERYADRIARIDDRAFRNWALVTVPLWLGTASMLAATVGGLALVWWTYALEGWGAVVAFYAGLGVLLVTTHGLAHLVTGAISGIGFTCWFIGSILQPQPGVKIDYSTYLRTRPRRRAWMHASGAILTKLLPFALLGAAIAADLPVWAVWGVVAIGVVAIVTDIAWSTSKSDWKRFRREMEFAQDS
ncbi:MAG: hypothetical protein KY394_02370 [Actinobacteria bacterium]|nr:hypothetical protein [Actinomycetota bacterium]